MNRQGDESNSELNQKLATVVSMRILLEAGGGKTGVCYNDANWTRILANHVGEAKDDSEDKFNKGIVKTLVGE